jgi:serine protease
MSNRLRRYAIGALAVGAVAGATAVAMPGAEPAWHPVAYGLTATPARLLPATVSTADPVRVVSTALDAKGRPVVTVKTATHRATAEKYVKQGQSRRNALGVELDAVATAAEVPTGTDPYRGQQWDLTKMRAADAWQKSTGTGATVAVIDTGVDASHPDLAGKILPGIDIISGVEGTSTDPNGHGTHVAGTIAALTGNGEGVAAVAPGAKILPIRVLGANGSGYMSDAATGIVYAADHGANVINMSLGSTAQVTAVTNAISYARGKGVVVVAAAGNERASGSPVSYPAADPGVIAVAATDSADAFAGYSNRGSYVDIAAPGSGIVSTYPAAKGSSYVIMSGTSMAAPHVAAVAALLESYRPGLTPDQVEQAMESSAVDLGPAGKDADYGYGRIDAAAALTAASPATAAPVDSSPPTPSPVVSVAPTSVPPTSTPTSGPTPTSSPTPTPTKRTPKVRPAIKVAASRSPAIYGTTATVTYAVTANGTAWARKPVRIGAGPTGGPYTYTEDTTDSAGKVVFSRVATGRFQVRLVVVATDTSVEAASGVTTFTVRSQAALTSASTGSLTVSLTGAAGQTVTVQRLERRRWLATTSYLATPEEPSHTLTGLTTGAVYRVVVATTASVLGLTSGAAKIS